jgi:hypothetical protein
VAEQIPARKPNSGMPRWVKVQGVFVILLVVVVVGMFAGVFNIGLLPGGGGHGMHGGLH